MSADGIFGRPLPAGYRDELAALVAKRPEAHAERAGSVLLFQLGGLRLALPARVASAVAPVLHIARIPHRSGTVLLGLAAFRGELLPCCSLARLLDVEQVADTAGTGRTLILEESRNRQWAVPIDGVLGVRTGIQAFAGDEPLPIAGQWVLSSFMDAGGVFHLLDVEVLFRQIALATA